ncbi:MAG: rubredoxin [Dethiobacteria bacterium]
MFKYICEICDYIYDPFLGEPRRNIPPGTSFEKLPRSWRCPICEAEKFEFQEKI